MLQSCFDHIIQKVCVNGHRKLPVNNFFLTIFFFLFTSVRTNFDLNPEQEQIQAQKARTINLQRVRKSQSESKIKILVYSVKKKKLHAHICKKYPRTCHSTMTKSTEFFIFTVVFLQPFALSLSFFLLVFFSVSL